MTVSQPEIIHNCEARTRRVYNQLVLITYIISDFSPEWWCVLHEHLNVRSGVKKGTRCYLHLAGNIRLINWSKYVCVFIDVKGWMPMKGQTSNPQLSSVQCCLLFFVCFFFVIVVVWLFWFFLFKSSCRLAHATSGHLDKKYTKLCWENEKGNT